MATVHEFPRGAKPGTKIVAMIGQGRQATEADVARRRNPAEEGERPAREPGSVGRTYARPVDRTDCVYFLGRYEPPDDTTPQINCSCGEKLTMLGECGWGVDCAPKARGTLVDPSVVKCSDCGCYERRQPILLPPTPEVESPA